MCKKEYEAEPRTGIMGEADVLVAASAPGKCILFGAVSYTHLTLPTILLV